MSKSIVEGVIEVVLAKELPEPDRFGNEFRHNVKMDDGTWYGFGTGKRDSINIKDGAGWHSLAKGDRIEFLAESRDSNGKTFWNAQKKTLTLKGKGDGQGSSVRAGSPNNTRSVDSVGVTKQVAGDDRQDQIMRQNAMAHASALVAASVDAQSDLYTNAELVLELADKYFLPYAKFGKVPGTLAELNEEKANEVASRQADEGEDFDDDLPF